MEMLTITITIDSNRRRWPLMRDNRQPRIASNVDSYTFFLSLFHLLLIIMTSTEDDTKEQWEKKTPSGYYTIYILLGNYCSFVCFNFETLYNITTECHLYSTLHNNCFFL
jgi:hypothetical protein